MISSCPFGLKIEVDRRKKGFGEMTSQEDRTSGPFALVEEAMEWVRSEPGLGWFLSQAVYLSQPMLETFWPSDQIERFASGLETGRKDASRPPENGRG
jgi:hypothetical protein